MRQPAAAAGGRASLDADAGRPGGWWTDGRGPTRLSASLPRCRRRSEHREQRHAGTLGILAEHPPGQSTASDRRERTRSRPWRGRSRSAGGPRGKRSGARLPDAPGTSERKPVSSVRSPSSSNRFATCTLCRSSCASPNGLWDVRTIPTAITPFEAPTRFRHSASTTATGGPSASAASSAGATPFSSNQASTQA